MKFTYLSLLLTLATSSYTANAQYGGYMESCNNAFLYDYDNTWYLVNDCYAGGNKYQNNLRLGDCLANDGGRLVPRPGGGFGGSCHSCNLVNCGNPDLVSCLQCTCGNGHGEDTTTINLNNGIIGNANGQLVCNGGKAYYTKVN